MEQIKKYMISKSKLEKAYKKLQQALNELPNEYIQDSVIQRFEFTFELLWKTLKLYLDIEGLQEQTPRQVLKRSFEIGLIEDIDLFLDMMDIRNLTSHTYNEDLAWEVYDFIKNNSVFIWETIKLLKNY